MHEQSVYRTGYGTVLDSGTTFTYLPSLAFSSFADLVEKAAAKAGLTPRTGPDPQVRACACGVCVCVCLCVCVCRCT